MDTWDLVKFLIVSFLPWILGKLFKALANAAKAQPQSDKQLMITVPSLWDRIRISILIVAVINYFWISLGGGCPKNFFQQIGADVDVPIFQLRTHYTDFVTRQAEASKSFSTVFETLKDSCCASGDADEFDLFRERLWNRKKLPSVPFFSSQDDPLVSDDGLKYQRLQCLFERLKSPSRRSNYLQYGEHAFLNCDWCTDEMDFCLFAIFSAAKDYCVFLVIIGLASVKKEKGSWRKILVVLTLFFGIFESLYYLAPHEVASLDIYADLFSDAENVGLTQKLTIIRHLFFGVCLLVALMFDNGIHTTNIEQIADITKQHESIKDLINLERLQKTVLVANKELRKHYISNFDKIENLTKASPEEFNRPTNFDVLDSVLAAKEDCQ
ncbi:hypothetical protein MDAP_000522 [Mitosporidium daphniae]|uniref:Uncharacterized protein n=1 Tax=Mitosporidium daphniae TaxID=1485682 RepID=A0A098VVR1_9MICR|nr:uncharacterized protein DI09_115p80 [Mitosporidium daphniae]KGG53042.1 hypothetical protein DI09_115p80 [Mitosporidium daphniae]|eukprot:XP_013239478.1 uncharacterized protein DI09_115p80 [Mitosporidium daphniae]